MTREEALQSLAASSAHDRLRAARFLARGCDSSDLHVLRAALQGETVSYVRTSLALAIKRASSSVPPLDGVDGAEEVEIPPDVRAHIRNEVTGEVTGRVLHEIASPVGLIAAAAAREIPNYEGSRTKRHIDALKRVFRAIEQLRTATALPKPEEFDLAELIAELVSEAVETSNVEVSLHGARPMVITADPAVLRLALANGIRNAVEAVSCVPEGEPYSIVVAWGETDIDYWVTVLDRGAGLVGPAESAFGTGKTTKRGHSGFGLTIARQAIETLGGTCTLQPAAEGGARFEVRWER